MDSAFELFPRSNDQHSAAWRKAYDTDPHNRCPGKDPIDQRCTCPDVMYSTRIRLSTGTSLDHKIYCGCCGHNIDKTTLP